MFSISTQFQKSDDLPDSPKNLKNHPPYWMINPIRKLHSNVPAGQVVALTLNLKPEVICY